MKHILYNIIFDKNGGLRMTMPVTWMLAGAIALVLSTWGYFVWAQSTYVGQTDYCKTIVRLEKADTDIIKKHDDDIKEMKSEVHEIYLYLIEGKVHHK